MGMANRWIANRVTEILGSEDDVVIELIFNLVEGGRYVRFPCLPYLPTYLPIQSYLLSLLCLLTIGMLQPDIKSLQIQLTGFLDKDTPTFCKDLWKLLRSAQTSPQGVPKELLEAKKLELMQEKVGAGCRVA
jgi:serine/arginine repetitive matrix protein 1